MFRQPNYPKYYPNTVMSEYSASQHAKYAVVADALKRNIFYTEFYAWLDVGYFRDACDDENQYFRINPPPEVDKNTAVYKSNEPIFNQKCIIFFNI